MIYQKYLRRSDRVKEVKTGQKWSEESSKDKSAGKKRIRKKKKKRMDL